MLQVNRAISNYYAMCDDSIMDIDCGNRSIRMMIQVLDNTPQVSLIM